MPALAIVLNPANDDNDDSLFFNLLARQLGVLFVGHLDDRHQSPQQHLPVQSAFFQSSFCGSRLSPHFLHIITKSDTPSQLGIAGAILG